MMAADITCGEVNVECSNAGYTVFTASTLTLPGLFWVKVARAEWEMAALLGSQILDICSECFLRVAWLDISHSLK